MHQNRASPFASDFCRRLRYRREFRSGNQIWPLKSQRKSPFASDFLRRGNRASWGLKNRAILRGSGENRRRNRRGSRDFGALRYQTSLEHIVWADKKSAGHHVQLWFNSQTLSPILLLLGHTPSTAGTFRKKFRKNSGKTPETLSERFLEFPSKVRLGCPKPYNSRHLRLPERFQNSLPPSTAGGASFFRSGSGEGLSEPVMEFPAVLGVSLIYGNAT